MKLIIPENYRSQIPEEHNRFAVQQVREIFTQYMTEVLSVHKIAAPLIIESSSGLSDNSMENNVPVKFIPDSEPRQNMEIVRSATKWKRQVLSEKLPEGVQGIWCDAMAVRPDEMVSNVHSLYVDQWDWERIIRDDQRNIHFLKVMANKVYQALVNTEKHVSGLYPEIEPMLPETLHFVHTTDLACDYPGCSPEEREYHVAKKYGAVFITGIGNPLLPGGPHSFRTADYDDWSTPSGNGYCGLNGDLIVWNQVLEQPLELSSMGIRVDKTALINQVEILNCWEVLENPWHRRVLAGEFPLSIGGGIGQSRVCMFMLRKAHIGEVLPSVWPEEMIRKCKTAGIKLLS